MPRHLGLVLQDHRARRALEPVPLDDVLVLALAVPAPNVPSLQGQLTIRASEYLKKDNYFFSFWQKITAKTNCSPIACRYSGYYFL